MIPADGIYSFVSGEDAYILVDGNNNTKVTITDKRKQVPDPANPLMVGSYLADVRTATFSSTYGATAKIAGPAPIVAFNGQRKSTEIGANAQTAEFWEYNGDVGRRWNLDPRPDRSISGYAVFSNNPLFNLDIKGDTSYPTPNGQIRLPENATDITISSGNEKPSNWHWSNPKNAPSAENLNKLVPPGTLTGFTVNGQYHSINLKRNSTGNYYFSGYINVSTKEIYKEPEIVSPLVGKTFDVVGATSTTVQAIGAGFERAAKLARSSGGVGSVPIGIPSGLSPQTPNVLTLGRVPASSAIKVNNFVKVVDNVSRGATIVSGVVNIVKDGKLTAGDGAVSLLTTAQIAFPIFGFAVGIYDLGSLIFGYKGSADLVHDLVDDNLPNHGIDFSK